MIKTFNLSILLEVEGDGNIYSTLYPRVLTVKFWESRGDLPDILYKNMLEGGKGG